MWWKDKVSYRNLVDWKNTFHLDDFTWVMEWLLFRFVVYIFIFLYKTHSIGLINYLLTLRQTFIWCSIILQIDPYFFFSYEQKRILISRISCMTQMAFHVPHRILQNHSTRLNFFVGSSKLSDWLFNNYLRKITFFSKFLYLKRLSDSHGNFSVRVAI